MASAATRARAPSGDDVRWQRAARPANTLRAPRCALQRGPTHTQELSRISARVMALLGAISVWWQVGAALPARSAGWGIDCDTAEVAGRCPREWPNAAEGPELQTACVLGCTGA